MARTALRLGSGFSLEKPLSQCVAEPVASILESVEQDVIGQSSVKQRMWGKYGRALRTVGQREGELAAIHRGRVKDAVKRGESLI